MIRAFARTGSSMGVPRGERAGDGDSPRRASRILLGPGKPRKPSVFDATLVPPVARMGPAQVQPGLRGKPLLLLVFHDLVVGLDHVLRRRAAGGLSRRV